MSFDIPDWKTIGIPEQVMGLAELTSGMILVTGTAGSGKTTTQACLIDRINRTRDCHIVTLEDPVEYLHRHQKSIVSQREIAIATGAKNGMLSMEQSIQSLYRQGRIEKNTALAYADKPEMMQRLLP